MYFPGVWPAVLTPFGDDGSVRADVLAESIRWYIDNGVHGIIAIGTLGEFRALDDDERQLVVSTISEEAEGKVPVTVGVSAESGAEGAALAVQAKRNKAHGIMALPPLTYEADLDELVAFFSEIADATDLPLMVYNNPASSKQDMSPATIAKLFEIESVVAVKESSGDAKRVAAIRELTDDKMEVLVGTDDVTLEGYCAGATGWVSGVLDVAPAECMELWNLLEAREMEAAQRLWIRLLPLARLDTHPKLVQFFKAALDEIGKYGGGVRPPRGSLSTEEQRLVVAALAALWPHGANVASEMVR